MINWNYIDLKGKTSGQVKVKCPACIDRRTNKRDTSLSVNITQGVARCHYCEEISIRDLKKKSEDFKLPRQDWHNYTKLSERVVKWFESRKISQSTIIDCGITEEKYYQPALGKEVQNVVYNYFEGDSVVNKKYRGPGKKFTQSTGTKNIFYGVNDIIGSDECYIVEGEMDKLALWEVGIKNCISVPNGANDNDDVWENSKKYLDGIDKFYIAVDCDDKGNALSEKISQRLGRWKCLRVEFKNKDANEDLIEGRDVLEKSLKNAKRYPVSGTFTAYDIQDSIHKLHRDGLPETLSPQHSSFGNLKNVFSVMRGHLVVATGIPSHGKSNFVEWYVMNLVNDYEMKASFFSPEHMPLALHQSNFISKFWAKPFFKRFGYDRVTIEEIDQYINWSKEKIYLTSPDKDEFPTWTWIFDKFKEQMYSFGIDIFVIDAFNKLDLGSGNKLDKINEVLSKLTIFAQQNNVVVFLVAHPTKMKKTEAGDYECPTLYDVSGSADFRNQTHDGFAVHRKFGDDDFTEFVNLKTKMSFQGKVGERVQFDYHVPSGRYFERGSQPFTDVLSDFNKVDNKIHSTENNLPQNSLKDVLWDTDDNDEIPF